MTAPEATLISVAPSKPDIMTFFPLEKARKSQEVCIREINNVFNSGVRIVILEAPVGSGKSAIATTLARYVGGTGAHIITPRKGLQDQYYGDFDDHLVLMKGRNAYPCTIDANTKQYGAVIKLIKEGKIDQPKRNVENCATAPCVGNPEVFKICTETRYCPYTVAMTLAQGHPLVVHNMHSFIFQTSFGKKFEKREILVVDEAHEVESTVRSFITKKIYVSEVFGRTQVESYKTWPEWETFLLSEKFVPKETSYDVQRKQQDPKYVSERQKYLAQITSLNLGKDLDKGFSVEVIPEIRPGTTIPRGTTFEFIPHHVGNAVQSMLLNFGEKVLLMSGTIYNKDNFCRNLGIDPAQAHFIRVGSSFPKENRPIYCLDKYQVNTSHATWNENFAEVIEKIQKISAIFHDVKGLIHTPSYQAAEQIANALNDPRYVTHGPADFQEKLEAFYADKEAKVFLSPVCQQGVDFKEDRARFQIIIRVPYLNTSSAFVENKVKNDFSWYNYQSLVIFGQQIGRVNRSESDYGVTFLLDERFNKFISRNSKVLPTWLKEAIVWKG